MRVAFVSVSDQMGGSEAMLLQIAAELRRTRPDWSLDLILPGPGPLGAAARAVGVAVSILPMPAALARLGESGLGTRGRVALAARLMLASLALPAYQRQLRAALATLAPDVVHTNGFKAHILAARVGPPGRGLVWHMHEYINGRRLTSRLLRRYAGRCSLVVANSQSVAADVRDVLGRAVEVRVIYNAVDVERFAPAGPAVNLDERAGLMPAPPDTVRVGLVATFSRWKGHDVFLRAIALLPAALPVRAYIVGGALYDTEGSQYSGEELHRLAEQYGVADRVGFVGFVAAADQVMRALDVVVHASTTPEPFGLVIAEAMACGRALVTSAAGGAAELVRDDEDALTHAPGDAPQLAAAIQALVREPSLRARLGRNARAVAARRFDARRLAGEFAEAYEATVGSRMVH